MSLPPRAKTKIVAGVTAAVLAIAAPFVTVFEGRVLKTYPDAVYGWKVPTACDGHVDLTYKPGQTFTNEECAELRDADLTKEFDALVACGVPVITPAKPLAAVLSLAHNVGTGAVCKSSIVSKLKAYNVPAACATILEFDGVANVHCNSYPAASVCNGLMRRRSAEHALCLS